MEQKEQLQHLSADELWSMREDVDLKLATILLKRKSMLAWSDCSRARSRVGCAEPSL